MKRTKQKKKPAAILTGDLHIREDTPVCRKDNFLQAQTGKLHRLSKLQEQYDCLVLCSGDVFHHWKPSPSLISYALEYLPKNLYTVYGNHDLPQHNLGMAYKSGVYTLYLANRIGILDEVHWGQEPQNGTFTIPGHEIELLIWHIMTFKDETPWPGCTDLPAKELLKRYPDYDLILTGHNHKPFVEQLKDQKLVNPGSITRQKAGETHDPVVFLWYKEDNSVEPVYLSDQPADNVITREHIEREEDKQKRFEALISKLNGPAEEVSFKANLEKHFSRHKTPKSVQNFIWQKYEEVYS